ncbi:hypothetical protein FACS1894170_03810 [Planctomycetales bacterium]|nr:hypothetical protein FACS1894170_03810 [Planctomycetales bacterium]
MKLSYSNRKIEKICIDDKTARKELGADGAKMLKRRLKEMEDATTLEKLRFDPGHFHELDGDRKGQLSCNIVGLIRLVFIPDNYPVPRKQDGGLDWEEITAVKNIEIVNYHK